MQLDHVIKKQELSRDIFDVEKIKLQIKEKMSSLKNVASPQLL